MSIAFLVAVAGWGYLTVRDTVPAGLAVGAAAPSFELMDLNGQRVTLEAFRGTPVMLRFSSRTCAFCYDDFDTLERFQQDQGDRVQVIAVEVGAPVSLVQSVVRGRNRSYPVLVDADGDVAQRYRIDSIPQIVFINGAGQWVGRVSGELADVDVETYLAVAASPTGVTLDAVEARARAIAQEVRCQECKGLSVWESNVASAWEMKQEIWERVAAGETRESILADLVNRYGVWILMRPPARGGFLWAYLVPVLFVAAGGLLLQRTWRVRDAGDEGAGAPGDGDVDPEWERRVSERLRDYF